MIAEALNYAATFMLTPRAFRPAVRYSINLWSRAGRCAAQWAGHERNSRAAILDAARPLRQRRTAVILGSGLLRDVPIVELSKLFDTVVLVDLVHPASTRAWLALKRLRNVRLVNRDLSGYDDLLTGKAPESLGFMRQIPYLDFTVSANLLSQIGTGAKKRLETEAAGAMPQDALHRLISAHLRALAALPCTSFLVTDVTYTVIDRNGLTHEQVDLLHGVPFPQGGRSWDWPVVPFGEESPDYQVVHRVVTGEGSLLFNASAF